MPDVVHALDAPRPHEAWTTRLRHRLPLETWVAASTLLLWVLLAFGSPYFLTSGNLFNMMRQVSTDAIIAYGELFAIILAGIDLSVGAVAGLTGVVFAMMLAGGVNIGLAVLGALALGLCIGLVNGLAIDRLGIPPFIVTLAGLQGFRGLTLLVSGGMTIAGMPDVLGLVSSTSVLGIPTMFIIMLVFGAGSQFLLSFTRLGRYMYAIGSNAEAARRVGISVTGVTLVAYSLAAVFASVRWHDAGGAADHGESERRDRRRNCRQSPRRWSAGQACSAGAAPSWDASSAQCCSPPSATAPTCWASTRSGRW